MSSVSRSRRGREKAHGVCRWKIRHRKQVGGCIKKLKYVIIIKIYQVHIVILSFFLQF